MHASRTVPPPPAAQPERIGPFELLGPLGPAAFGTTYRARDTRNGREVFVHALHRSEVRGQRAVDGFLARARVAAELRHPHLLPLLEAGGDGTHCYVACCRRPGHSLAQVLCDGQLELPHAAGIVRALADVLDHGHRRGVVHGDVRPGNVWLDEAGTPFLLGLGLAHRRELAGASAEESGPGEALHYLAPELADGEGRATAMTDQYALGVLLYHLLCGQTPFDGPPVVLLFSLVHGTPTPPRSLRPDLPAALESCCLKAMARQSEERFADCRELADGLERWLATSPRAPMVVAVRPATAPLPVREIMRSPLPAGKLTLQNMSRTTIAGPFRVVFCDLHPALRLVNGAGNTADGAPYLHVRLRELAAGQSFTVAVRFARSAPLGPDDPIAYRVEVYHDDSEPTPGTLG